MKALVFEPHDDDLIIGIGATALKLLDSDWDIKSVQMTDGRHGSNKIDPEELVDIRRKEKEKEIDFLGIECEFCDYEDGNLWEIMNERGGEIVSELQEIVEDFKPDVVFMPARDEGHPDHRATNLLADKALDKSGSDCLRVSYIVWNLPFLEGDNLAEKVVRVSVEAEYSQKIEALRLHESQIDEGDYDKIIENFNSYLGHIYSSYDEKKGKSEVLGVQNPEKIDKLNSLEFEDVSSLNHGRSEENIDLE